MPGPELAFYPNVRKRRIDDFNALPPESYAEKVIQITTVFRIAMLPTLQAFRTAFYTNL